MSNCTFSLHLDVVVVVVVVFSCTAMFIFFFFFRYFAEFMRRHMAMCFSLVHLMLGVMPFDVEYGFGH